DYFHFQLLNTILGGYFGSRLMANIREDKGYTYGIGSGMAVLQETGYFFISTEVGKDVKEETMTEIHKELKLLTEELITEDELMKVKNYMLGEFLRHADGSLSQMEMFKNIYFNDLKETYYFDFIQAVHDATLPGLKRLAEKYLNPKDMLTVISG
ncbi:MAG: zinc protease, partial [Arenicella sp.]